MFSAYAGPSGRPPAARPGEHLGNWPLAADRGTIGGGNGPARDGQPPGGRPGLSRESRCRMRPSLRLKGPRPRRPQLKTIRTCTRGGKAMVAETILRPIVLFAIGLALLLISFQ